MNQKYNRHCRFFRVYYTCSLITEIHKRTVHGYKRIQWNDTNTAVKHFEHDQTSTETSNLHNKINFLNKISKHCVN